MDKLFGKTVGMLSSMLDYQSKRHKLIASNIANIDTPGYRSKDLTFQCRFTEQMENKNNVKMVRTHKGHLSNTGRGEFDVVNSGEKVNIDKQMVKLAENNLMYNLSVELLARKFKSLTTVLREAK
jgi:flagellar basal-body rod protein FlgB